MENLPSQSPQEEVPSARGRVLQWQWVFMSIVVGTMLVSLFVTVTTAAFGNPFIPARIGSLGVVVTGFIVGYFSPGVTIKEPAIAGSLLVVIVLFVLYVGFNFELTWYEALAAIGFGFLLSLLGAWIGEAFQGHVATRTYGLQWKWIAVGVTVGFVLNNFFVFLLSPLFNINLTAVLVSFLVSFVLTGFVVGYKSPGVTIKEAAIAGLLTVVLDWLIWLIVDVAFMPVPLVHLVVTLIAGFLLAMIGAWVGEKLQAALEGAET